MVSRWVWVWIFTISLLYPFNQIINIKNGIGRLVISFEKPLNSDDIHNFELRGRNSHRYVFDFKNTKLLSYNLLKNLRYSLPVKSIRASQYTRDTARVVVETQTGYDMRYYKPDSFTLIVTLPNSNKSSGKTNIKSLFSTLYTNNNPTISNKKSDIVIPKVSKKVVRNSYLMKNMSVTRPKGHYRIIIDPGHGGHDSGALGGSDRSKMEKVAVLQIAKRVARYLKNMGFDVLMTRSSDRFIKLSRRTRYANKKHGDIFVSIHANAVPRRKWNESHGIETYFLQVTRSARAKRVAARENSVVLNKKDYLTKNVILDAVYTGPKIVLSNKLALDVQRSMLGQLRKKYKNVKDGGVRPAPFWVLVGAEMPAILVETGYITNPMERRRLFDPKYQDLMARGIAQGIARYLANREKEIE